MRRIVIGMAAGVLVGLVTCVALGCGGGTPTTKKVEAGQSVTLAVGQRMEIALASNPTTGYSWQVADDAGGIVSLVDEPEFVPDSGPVATGRGGTEVLTFVAEKGGTGTLVLEYRRPWEKGVAPSKTVEVAVTVE